MDRAPSSEPARLRSGRHGLSKADVARSQRERLLESITELVAAKGYPSTTVSDVVDLAGVSRATFYEQFHDKEECFLVAHDAIMEEVIGRVMPAFALDAPWAEQFRAAVVSLLVLLVERPAIAQVGVVEVLGGGDLARARYDQSVRLLSAFIALGGEGVELPDGLREGIPLIVLGGITSAIGSEVSAGRAARLPELLPDLLYIAYAPYMGQRDALRLSGLAGA